MNQFEVSDQFIIFSRVSDALITLAYFTIPTFMIIFGYRNEIKSNNVIWLFMGFITACGITHLISIFNHTATQIYILGVAKFITAIISLLTACFMTKQLPRIAYIDKQINELERNQLNMSNYIFHEIRIPFHSIKLCIADLQRSDNLNDIQLEILDIMHNSVEHSSKILNDLLNLAKIAKGQFEINRERVVLDGLINPIIKSFDEIAKKKNISFKIVNNLPPGTRVCCDSTRISQCLNNFLSNAFKFTPNDRIVSLEINSKQHELFFTVSDQGCGIPHDELENLFKPFINISTGKSSEVGTGLGLTISKQIAILHGGDIEVKSLKDRGSDFTLRILSDIQYPNTDVVIDIEDNKPHEKETDNKKVKDRKEKNNKKKNENKEDLKEKHKKTVSFNNDAQILIVDDNKNNRFLLSRYLEFKNLKSDLAKNGQDALDHLNKKNNYQVIFMDKNMPIMDGQEAIKQIRNDGIDIPIVVLSGITSIEDQKTLKDLGANHIMTKPVHFDILDEIMSEYFEDYPKK